MSSYAVFFDYNNTTIRLPVNPETIETTTVQANEKYEILKLGQIAVPTYMELREYSFETELPKKQLHYVETIQDFKEASYYLDLLREWRVSLEPIRFIASNDAEDEINVLILIEELKVTEKAGEEGDKYISFKLLEYREYSKKAVIVTSATGTSTKKEMTVEETNPKNKGSYVVQTGDSLWAIAMNFYHDGAQSEKIYNANKDKIKNPALIYAGQELIIPS